jgi:hypothetical protein
MPQNIQLRQRIGGSFNNADSVLYPQTIPSQVIGLLDGGKITTSLLPEFVIGGMRFSGTINASAGTTEANAVGLDTLFTELTFANWATTSQQSRGIYKVVTHAGFIKNVDGTSGSVAYHQFQPNLSGGSIGEEGDNTPPIYLEIGDWIVFSTAANPAGGFNYFFYSVVNNTYGEVTTTTAGVMSAADKTKLDGIASNANNYVHPSITAVNVDTSGSTIIDSIVSNGNGHLTSVGTRTLTLADLGYVAPTPYTHPTHPGDDIDVDTGALTGAVVISDLDFNITTDTSGHVTDANATIATRTLTLADLGYVAPTIGNGTLTVTGNSGLSGTGTFTANQGTNTTITLSHADTSSVSNQDLTDAETVDTITFDTYGHITAITKQAIRAASKTATGLIEIATSGTRTGTLTEAEAGTDDTRSMTPLATKTSISFHTGNTLYANFGAADTAGHPDGAIVFVTV